MKFKLIKNNNSKKLFIEVSILFCTVILILGTTFAYFTQSNSKSLDNVATSKVTLSYKDNTNYMRNNIIPVVESDVTKFASKNTLNNYTDNDICHYQDDMYACSLYEFTITNAASVSQNIIVSMTPIINEYNNFYFILYESKVNELNNDLNKIVNNTKIEKDTINFNNTNIILKPEESKTYTIVFYIKNLDEPQDDANKRFTASILVNSVTTGYKKIVQLGKGCYDFETLDDGTLKLTKFNGINNESGEPIESCGVIKEESGLYSVTVPSSYAGVAVSTLGNTLFYQMDVESFDPNDMSTLKINRNMYIKEFTINEGVTTIENGFIFDAGLFGEVATGTFISVGYDFTKQQVFVEDGVKINLPNSLKYIGDYAFNTGYIKEIKISNNLEYIGVNSFYNTPLTTLTFEEGSNLKIIEDGAFENSQLTTLTIPSSVQKIGDYAFQNNQILTKIDFVGAKNGTSQLKEIGEGAFDQCNLTYDGSSEEEYLIIPESVTYIGSFAFSYYNTGNDNLKFIRYMGTREQLDLLWEKHFWYRNDIATVKAFDEV